MIFWKTDSQLTHISVDTEPFSLSQVLHTSYTFVLLQHRKVSMAGTAWPASWPQRQQEAGHLQEMGRSKFTHPGREPSVITTGSSFPFLRGKERFFQLGKCPKSQNLKGATTLIKPITGTYALQFVHALSWNSNISLSTPQQPQTQCYPCWYKPILEVSAFLKLTKMLKTSKILP